MDKNNKLIAEFMGWTLDDSHLDLYRKRINGKFKYLLLSQLKYDTDWNHLMPVVERIETMSLTENRNHLPEFFIMYDQREDFKGWYWSISITKLFRKECLGRESTKIEALYAAVVEFIKWYNTSAKVVGIINKI